MTESNLIRKSKRPSKIDTTSLETEEKSSENYTKVKRCSCKGNCSKKLCGCVKKGLICQDNCKFCRIRCKNQNSNNSDNVNDTTSDGDKQVLGKPVQLPAASVQYVDVSTQTNNDFSDSEQVERNKRLIAQIRMMTLMCKQHHITGQAQ